MEDELILSPADQAKLSNVLNKMREKGAPESAIDFVTKDFTQKYAQPAVAEEVKKKSTGEFPSQLETSPAAFSWRDLYETPKSDVPKIFGSLSELRKSPSTAYGATSFKADEKFTYPFFHGEKKEREDTGGFFPSLKEEKPLAGLEAAVEGKAYADPGSRIVDESPNELQRLYNRSVARGLRGQIAAGVARPGNRIEDLAYLNYIEQRDAPRKGDWLAAAPGTFVGAPAFLLDAIRSSAESLISQFAASPVGIAGAVAGAGAGAGTGAALGAVGGPLAGVTAAGGATLGAMGGFSAATSAAIEYGSKINEVLAENGVDVTDEQQLSKAFADEELMAKAKEMGLRRAIPVAAFDAIAGMVGGKLIAPALAGATAKQVAKVAAKEAGIQAGLGAAGELSGQVVAGEEIKPREIALEAFSEVLTPGLSTAYNIIKEKAPTEAERQYAQFASEQDQKRLAEIRNLTFAVNNAEIANLDDQISDLRRSRIEEGRPERKAIDEKIKSLVEQKYTRMRSIQEDLLAVLSDEEIAQANTLVGDIINASDVLKKNPDLSEAERTAIEEQFNSAAQQLQDIYDFAAQSRQQQAPQPSDTETVAQEVQSRIPEGQEPGGVFQPAAGQKETTAGRALQKAREEILRTNILRRSFPGTARMSEEQRNELAKSKIEQGLTPEDETWLSNIEDTAIEQFKNREFANLFDPYERLAYVKEMESQTPSFRREMEKLLLAFDAFKSVAPNAQYFNVGFGKKGYTKAARDAGFSAQSVKGTLGITSAALGDRVVVQFSPQKDDVRGIGYKGVQTPFKTAAHEIFHNVWSQHFDKNLNDFNQFRELVIRRLKESDVKRLNDFANLYDEREDSRSGGAYKSEEFMTDLGALLADDQVTFENNFLEELKAFLNNIVAKLTGQRVQIFEDSALARDIASYMTGVTQTIKTGGDVSAVPVSARLKSDRFRRANKSTFEADGAVTDIRYENMAGRPEPTTYERQLRSDEKFIRKVGALSDDVLLRIEKFLKSDRLRGIPKAIVQAMEVSESMNIQHMNRLFLAMSRIRKEIRGTVLQKGLSPEQTERVNKLTYDVMFSEDEAVRAEAAAQLQEEYPKIASDVSILVSIRAALQDTLMNSTAFDNLSDVLRETIKDRNQYYGTRTYRLFTDPKFKVDESLREQAINDIILLETERMAEDMALEEEGSDTTQIFIRGPFGEKYPFDEARPGQVPDQDDYMAFVQQEFGKKISDNARKKVNGILELKGQSKSMGDSKLGELRVPSKQFKQRSDLPDSLRKLMGEETNPFVKFSQTVTNLTSIIERYTLVDRVNQAARNSGLNALIVPQSVVKALKDAKLSWGKMNSLAIQMRLIDPDDTATNNKRTVAQLRNMIMDKLRADYTEITEQKSPMYGKWAANDFLTLFQQTPLYDSSNVALKFYYKQLLQLRRVRVLYNLPTWRKNIMGGWYFLFANGVLPYNSARGGVTVFKDFANRMRKWKTGQYDADTEAVFDELAELGLLGASINAGLLSSVNQSYMDMYNDVSPNKAWSWLNRLNTKGSRIGYQYGAIDDYTKMIAYLYKRENFAKRLASNPEGKSYAELSPEQQAEVRQMTAERIKQTFPTMSRLHPSFRQISKLPFGDFLSFRLEAFRSYYGIFENAIADINEGINNTNLSASQRQAYMVDGLKSLSALIIQSTMSNIGYIAIAQSFFDDEEEKELAVKMRGVPFLMPDWMKGSNVVPISMAEDGTIRYINISSEDPYDEVSSLIFGREGIARSESLQSLVGNFAEPNISVKLWYNILEGKDNYGKPIVDNKDATWYAKALGTGAYIGRQYFVPPNIDFIRREILKRMEARAEDPEIDLRPLETTAQLSQNLVFRDYPVNIGQQFYYNLKDQKFEDSDLAPWVELGEAERANRRARLDQVKEAYQTIVQYGEHFENYDLIDKAQKNLNTSFRNDDDALYYVLYDIPLPE